ncbi:MAG: GNAT family N-acetyltransferase [Roseateles sp.]|uniref:GNAT family N-acetyltransferase n=1 Tax=Roseateles sp. TaxID=1971397 RepID=UPI00403645BD
MGGETKVRQATAADLPRLCEARNTDRLFRAYLHECDGQRAYFLLAETAGRIAGFGLLYLDVTKNGKKKSRLPKLSDLYVVEQYRRRGVATALIQAREDIARRHGHAELYVSIDPFESPEMRLLAHKLGYEALQSEPYRACAVHHDTQGVASEKTYFRLDFKKCLT